MALSAKLWPFTSLSNDKVSSAEKSTSFLPKATPMNSSLFSGSTVDDEILEQLNSTDFELRLRTLNRLRNLALGHELWFKRFSKKLELFKAFASVLSDSNWEVQHQCIKFLSDTMPDYGHDLEWCMTIILPDLIPKLASPKITVRRVCLQCLLAYVNRVDGVHALQKALIQYGLSKIDKNQAKEILKEMPNLFTSEFRVYNWSVLTEGLIDFLCTAAVDRETSDLILIVLERLLNLVGQYQFNNYIHSLPPNKKVRYEELLLQRGSSSVGYAHNGRISTTRGMTLTRFDPEAHADESDEYQETSAVGSLANGKQFRYGIIPVSLVDQLNNETDWQIRYDGLEMLKTLVENMKETDMKKLQPHLFSYINLLSNILDDLNIKNIILALDTLRASVVKMRRHVEPHLQHVVGAMAKHLGNQKAVVKQLNLSIILELMRQLHPKPVFAVLCGYLQHRNSRVREEVLNIVTITLLTHPSSDFNISAVAHIISSLLADAKRRVRLAAFEGIAVLANCVGTGKMETIMKHVREVEETRNAPGLVHAVQARLSRNQLPKIRGDGLLEYAAFSGSPSGDEPRKFAEVPSASSADIEWIMSAGVGQGSAVSRSLSPIRFRATTAMEKQQTVSSVQEQRQQTPAPVRRVLSAGRTLHKLPWENGHDERLLSIQQQADRVNNRSAPARPNESPVTSDSQQRTAPRPAKLVDHLSNVEDQLKPSVSSVNKYSQHLANGKVVLSPLDSNSRSNVFGLDVNPKMSSPLALDEPASLDRKNWNTRKGEDENQQQLRNDVSMKKAQSVNTLVSVSSVDYKNPWDETPIKPASREQIQTYFADNIPSASAIVAHSNITTTVNSQRHSLVERVKSVADGGRSDSSDVQSDMRTRNLDLISGSEGGPVANFPPHTTAETPTRNPSKPPPYLVKRPSVRKVGGPMVTKNRSPPPARKLRSDSTSEASSEATTRPYPNPHQALNSALKKLSSDEWSAKVEGIGSIERLAQYNTDFLVAEIQPIIIALNNEVRNLRSIVSKQALECYCRLFQHLKRSMDPEVERVCAVLMAKTGDTSNAFMREGATRALENMIDHVSPQKSLCSIVGTGASHKSATVRSACSQLMLRLVENMGAAKVLSSQPDFLEKVLITACQFANDNQPQPRYYGKAVLASLSKDPEFIRASARCLTESQQRTVLHVVDSVKLKGLGNALSNSGSSATLSLLSSSTSSYKGGRTVGRTGSVRRKAKLPDEAVDTFMAAEKELSSNSWEERFKGVNRVNQLSQSYAKTLCEDVKLLETYMTRLNDINGKVSAQALQCLPSVLANVAAHIGEVVRPVATEMVKSLSSQLPSKNDDIRSMAQQGLDCAVQYLEVSQNIHSTKPKLVQMYALPVLFELVRTQQMDQSLRHATVNYARTLARLTGTRALVEAATLSPDQRLELEDMLT